MVEALNNHFLPGMMILFRSAEGSSPEIDNISPFTGKCGTLNGKATAYVCSGFSCRQPTTDADTMITFITENR
jgi:uncharacterized protein YyaL (SSP411 family)